MKTLNYRPLLLMMVLSMTVFLWALPASLSAHGVAWELSSQQSYGLEFTYDDETPMGFAEIKVFGPNDATKLSQTGRTDKNGFFAFIPDAEGQWLVTADDGGGHLAQADLTVNWQSTEGASVDAAPASVNTEREIAKATKPIKIVLVISLFLNLAFAAMMFKRKKNA